MGFWVTDIHINWADGKQKIYIFFYFTIVIQLDLNSPDESYIMIDACFYAADMRSKRRLFTKW